VATISTRLTNAGTLLVNGNIDEVTFNTSTPTITNLFYSSQDFSSNILWQKSSSVTISNTSATLAPDGTTTAQLITVGGAGTYPYIRSYRSGSSGSVVPCTPGTTYTVSMFVKYINQQYVNIVNEDTWSGGMSTRFDILNGVKTAPSGNVAATTMTNVGNGWWRISATYVPVPAGITYWNPQPIRIGSFNATNYSGSQVYVWGAQLEASSSPSVYQGIAAAGTLVTPTWATRTVPDTVYSTGNFDEVTFSNTNPTIKNLLQYTEQFDINASWIKTRSNIGATNAVVAPDGTLTADKLIEDTTATQTHYINGPSSTSYVTSSSLPVASIYVKAGERTSCGLTIVRDAGTAFASGTFNVDLSTGTVLSGSGNIASAGNGWYRISTPATTFGANYAFRLLLNQSGTTNNYTGDGTSGLYIWGAQLEPGNIATIYQGKGASTILTSNFARRETQSGDMYVTNSYDEYTGAPVVDGDLKCWLDASQTASYPGTGTTWSDLSGNNNTGTLTSSPGFDNPTGSITFNGSGSSSGNTITFSGTVTGASLGLYQNSFTVGAWVNNNITTTGASSAPVGGGIFSIDGSAVAGGQYAIFNRWGNIWVDFYGEGQNGPAVSSNTWYYIAHTYNYTTKQSILYQNGVAVNTSTRTQDLVASVGSTSPKIGVYGLGGSWWNGKISSVHVYNRALTADEVAQNFNALRRRYNI
jgi:hypothetical protein